MAYDNGDRAQYLDLTFRCRYLGGDALVADDETSTSAGSPSTTCPTSPTATGSGSSTRSTRPRTANFRFEPL